jgi:crossover junction endodeoxyribonuclease RuvC
MNVVGIDPSLTGTGLAAVYETPGLSSFDRIETKPTLRNVEARRLRLTFIVERVAWFVTVHRPEIVVIESPSFGSRSKGAAVYERAGLYWLIVDAIARLGHGFRCEVIEAAPTQRAKYATGNGSASKVSVVERTLAEHPQLARKTHSDDEIDAYVLGQIGRRILGISTDANEDYRDEVAAKVAAQRGRS